jgi:predicted transcriptional regulator of viral defense system
MGSQKKRSEMMGSWNLPVCIGEVCEHGNMTHRDIPNAVSRSLIATAATWRAQGVSKQQMRSLERSGHLVRVRRGVYASRSAVRWAEGNSRRAHVLSVFAARATVGRRGVASYHSAAQLHGLDLLKRPPGDRVTLTVPPDKRWERVQPAGIVFHASELPPEHVTKLYKLPVTTVARTVVDLARTLPYIDGVVVADSALREEKATKPELRQVLNECARWPGVKQARRVVEFADERAGSPLESAARVAFAEAGLDPPELQATIHGPGFSARVDFLWRGQKVVVETDGLAKYNDRKDIINQFDRDRLLRDAGYKVVHFTWRELFETPEVVIARIRQALAAASPY